MDYGHELQFGVFVTPSAADPEGVVRLAVEAEAAGLDLVSFQDHPYQPKLLDAWTLLSYVAGRTSRIRLAPNVLNLPLRDPAVVARAAVSLDLLSGGRCELGLGAGAFWDPIVAMGAPRRSPGESVDALEEAIDVIRALWAVDEPGQADVEGTYYRLRGAARGPAPVHPIPIWVGAYKPRMLGLVGRKADGWLPSLPYLQPGDLARGNAAIDEAARAAGRDPRAIRRLLNLPPLPPHELARLALEDGISTFFVMADDSATLAAFVETAALAREQVEAARGGSAPPPPAPAAPPDEAELGVEPTPDEGIRLSGREAWDESSRPRRPEPAPGTTYTRRGRLVAQHLVDVHDMLRGELTQLRDVLRQVREGLLSAGDARSALNDMALRQNDWTLGAFCARYCAVVAGHHGLEDDAIFPHLRRSEGALEPVIDRLAEEHLVIHDAIQAVDAALVHHMTEPDGLDRIQEAIDFLGDALLSHLSYEEHELLEPLARLGFYPGQL